MLRNAVFCMALILLLSGCSKEERPRPPNERNRMVLNFFDAMKEGRSADAALQAERLQALLPDSDFLRLAADTQKANETIRKMNELLKEGKIKEVSKVLDSAMMESPFNEQLKRCSAELAKLESLDRAVRDMDPDLPSDEQQSRLARLKNSLAPFGQSKEVAAVIAAAEHNLNRKIRQEERDWHLFCDGLLLELNAAQKPDAELRSTVRILRGMGSVL